MLSAATVRLLAKAAPPAGEFDAEDITKLLDGAPVAVESAVALDRAWLNQVGPWWPGAVSATRSRADQRQRALRAALHQGPAGAASRSFCFRPNAHLRFQRQRRAMLAPVRAGWLLRAAASLELVRKARAAPPHAAVDSAAQVLESAEAAHEVLA
jgi:hypothetical protein